MDRQRDRDKRTAQRVLADIVGQSMRWATRITKATRTRVGDEAHYEAGGAARDDALAQEA